MGRLAAAPHQLLAERETHGAEGFFPSFLPLPSHCLMEEEGSHTHPFLLSLSGAASREGWSRKSIGATPVQKRLCSADAKERPKGSVPMLTAMLETRLNIQAEPSADVCGAVNIPLSI